MKKLRPAQLVALVEKITQDLEGMPGDPDHPANRRKQAMDGKTPTRVLTNPSEIAALAQKIRLDTVGVQAAKKPAAPSARAVEGFNQRYPDARKIKLGM